MIACMYMEEEIKIITKALKATFGALISVSEIFRAFLSITFHR